MAQKLKAYNVVATVDVNPEVVDNLGCTEFTAYDADEVDAVLAEKDKEIAKHKSEEYADTCRFYECELRHHKYKRCLTMVDYCYTNVHCIMGHRLCALSVRKKEWFDRWHKRWLELAEKFKEAK